MSRVHPLSPDAPGLLLAPMQGLTHRVVRDWFVAQQKPDLIFTEFIRAQTRSRRRVIRKDPGQIDFEAQAKQLVVQIIGHDSQALCETAFRLQKAGARSINLNLGCPYGRMTSGRSGGELLSTPAALERMLRDLRQVIPGDFSLKCRAGYEDPQQIFSLLPLFEAAGVDWLILHPRTVVQQYRGQADHQLTAEVVARTSLPVIANGDINTVAQGLQLLEIPGLRGLMLGRGALADPWLFQRLRQRDLRPVTGEERSQQLQQFIRQLVPGFAQQFCGERQTLMKLKDLLNFIPDPSRQRVLGKMKRAQSLERFLLLLEQL